MNENGYLQCKNCTRLEHPVLHRKYNGYCLECSNAGAEEKDEQIRELEAALAASQAECERLKEQLEEARRDTERLDWLERQIRKSKQGFKYVSIEFDSTEFLRQALDKDMRAAIGAAAGKG